ncbi:hypothetical protein D918_01712 [Trichuris suis]|nr:hypothetical protein D918_01712 [Trichuris suis]
MFNYFATSARTLVSNHWSFLLTLLLSFLAMMTGVLLGPAELYCYLWEPFYTGYFKERLVYQCLGIFLRDCFGKQRKIAFRVPWQGETFASL